MIRAPIFKEIILVGGGHAHALLIRRWAMKPLAGVRLTLISPQAQTPYSGMLPGLVAGHYNPDQMHIDLPKLCHWAGVRFIQGRVEGLDAEQKMLTVSDRPNLYYDVLSLDIGSTPNHQVVGVAEYATAIKPIAKFYQGWQTVLEALRQKKESQSIAVVGGGAGSIETILAMVRAIKSDSKIVCKVQFKLIYSTSSILTGYSEELIKSVENTCHRMKVSLHGNFKVNQVEESQLNSEQGQQESFDFLFWCTQASAAQWPAEAGLACTSDGFVKVNDELQSINYPEVFASGDIAHMDNNPRPKAGVYAVRQAPFLYENVQRYLLERTLKTYSPQDDFLSLLSLGDKKAVANHRYLSRLPERLIWQWKNYIDRKFMRKFHVLPKLKMPKADGTVDSALIPMLERQEKLQPKIRCAGCGAKIGSGILSKVLTELTGDYQPEDACVIEWPDSRLLQTIDHIKAPFDDPYMFGRIAVQHALSDLYAMNAVPHSIQVALTLPFAGRDIQTRELRQLLQGVLSVCDELKVKLLGGHSTESEELSLAVVANGRATEQGFTKQGLKAGDLLVVSKPLGTGLILAGQMSGGVSGADFLTSLHWMNKSNYKAAQLLNSLGVSACTDVTGFGLLGHLSEMLSDSNLQVELSEGKIPCLPGAWELAKQGVRSSLFPQNAQALVGDERWQVLVDSEYWSLLLDPQTSGGLLAGISPEQQNSAEKAGLYVIGEVKES